MIHEIGHSREVSTNIKKRSYHDLIRVQAREQKAREEHYDHAEPPSRRYKTDEGSSLHKQKERDKRFSTNNKHYDHAEPSSRKQMTGKGSSHDLIRTQSRKLQARQESFSISSKHNDYAEPSSRRQEKHLAGADYPRPPLLIEAEKYMSKEDKERWETQNRELWKRFEQHKNNLKNFDDNKWHKLAIDLIVASKRQYGKIFHPERFSRSVLQQMSDLMADSLKADLSKVCNDMVLYANDLSQYVNKNNEAVLRHLEHLDKMGQGEEIDFDNLHAHKPYRDCLSYYTKLGRQTCKEWGEVVIGLVERYNRIAGKPIKTSDLNLNKRNFFTEEDVIQNLQNFDATFDVL